MPQPGLIGRGWPRHAFYAPDVYTGYAVGVMPGGRGAFGRNGAKGVGEQLARVRAVIERGTQALKRALAALEQAPGISNRDLTLEALGGR